MHPYRYLLLMKSTRIYFTGFLIISLVIFGCKPKKNCNTPPSINVAKISFNEDSSKVILVYSASDLEDQIEVKGKLTIGNDVTKEIYKTGKNLNETEYFDISSINKTTIIKLELGVSEKDFEERPETDDCVYEGFPPTKITSSLITKKDFLIFQYNTREFSFLIFLLFLFVLFIFPALKLDANRISFVRSLKLAFLLFPTTLGLILGILQLNSLVDGESNHWHYILITFILLVSIISTYLINRFIIPKVKI